MTDEEIAVRDTAPEGVFFRRDLDDVSAAGGAKQVAKLLKIAFQLGAQAVLHDRKLDLFPVRADQCSISRFRATIFAAIGLGFPAISS